MTDILYQNFRGSIAMLYSHVFHKALKSTAVKSSFETQAVILGQNKNSKDMVASLSIVGISSYVVFSKTPFDTSLGNNAYDNAMVISVAGALINYLNHQLSGEGKRVVVSSDDTYTVLLAFAEVKLNENLIYQQISQELVKKFVNKIEFYKLCSIMNVDTPLSFVIENRERLMALEGEITFPGIVKPQYSGAVPKDVIPKVMRINDFEELIALAEKVWENAVPVFYQEMIPGNSESIFFVGGIFSKDIEKSQLFIGQKILEMPIVGGSTSHAVLKWNEEVLLTAHKIIQTTGYEGLADMEFKYDKRDQKYKIIEVNPRIGRWHAISRIKDLDVISYYVVTYSGLQVKASNFHCEGKTWISPYLALCGYIETKGIFIGLFCWIKAFMKADIKVDVDDLNMQQFALQIKVVLGHLRKLSLKNLIIGN